MISITISCSICIAIFVNRHYIGNASGISKRTVHIYSTTHELKDYLFWSRV